MSLLLLVLVLVLLVLLPEAAAACPSYFLVGEPALANVIPCAACPVELKTLESAAATIGERIYQPPASAPVTFVHVKVHVNVPEPVHAFVHVANDAVFAVLFESSFPCIFK